MKYLTQLAAMVLGKTCAACKVPCIGSIICDSCSDLIVKQQLHTLRCTQCANRLHSLNQHNTALCTACTHQAPTFDAAVCVGDFTEPLSQLISQLKFSHCLINASWFAKQLHQSLNTLPKPLQQFDLIVPIPLHVNRLRERGFNQAWEIIRYLPYPAHQKHPVLERLRDTPSQRHMNAAERVANVSNAFMVYEHCLELVKNKRILLVDDVVTTTATAQAAGKALKAAGVAHITLASVARVSH
jgi:ComF family protein